MTEQYTYFSIMPTSFFVLWNYLQNLFIGCEVFIESNL